MGGLDPIPDLSAPAGISSTVRSARHRLACVAARPSAMTSGASQTAAYLSVPALEVAVELAHAHRDCRNPAGRPVSPQMKIPRALAGGLT